MGVVVCAIKGLYLKSTMNTIGKNEYEASGMKNEIEYKEERDIIYIKAVGQITANNCYLLRKKIFERLEHIPAVRDIFTDLSDCSYMDSTFMGILIGVNKRFKSMRGKAINIVCPSEECRRLFTGLGIIKLLHVNQDSIKFPAHMEAITSPHKPSVYTILKAHEDLMETSDANKSKFKLLKEILEKKINQEK
jgi:anti-anti-sigma factor